MAHSVSVVGLGGFIVCRIIELARAEAEPGRGTANAFKASNA
jgi:hypothetical protein